MGLLSRSAVWMILHLFSLTALGAYPERMSTLAERYSGYDYNQDGIAEINQLELLFWEGQEPGARDKLVLVLVEKRLIDLGNPASSFLKTRLLDSLYRYVADLKREGYVPRVLSVDAYKGARFQNGLTLLAMRRLFKDVRRSYAGFRGAVLVGNFPESTLMRSWIWRKDDRTDIGGVTYESKPYLSLVPEIIASRTDLVLSDLDGNWESLYKPEGSTIQSYRALPDAAMSDNWPASNTLFTSSKWDRTNKPASDVFYIRDNDTREIIQNGKLTVRINSLNARNPELTEQDRQLTNPIARPEISISRINARSIAHDPDLSYRDERGRGLLDNRGKPGAFSANANEFYWAVELKQNESHEFQLLIGYFSRNERYRNKQYPGLKVNASAIAEVAGSDDEIYTKVIGPRNPRVIKGTLKDGATPVDFVNWLKTPALIRLVSAHSTANSSVFRSNYNAAALTTALGGPIWQWRHDKEAEEGIPATDQIKGTVTPRLYRTIWQNRLMAGVHPSFYVHWGCNVNSITPERLYDSNAYSRQQHAESILFYLEGLAVMARAKVFYDVPRNNEGLGVNPDKTFGLYLTEYFAWDAADENDIASKEASRKRAYAWGIVGDWTLKLGY